MTIMHSGSLFVAFRNHLGVTVRDHTVIKGFFSPF